MPARHAPVVIRHAHLEDRDSQPLNPFAQSALAVPFGIPVRQQKYGRGLLFAAKNLPVHSVVLGIGRSDRAGKRQHAFIVHPIVSCRRRLEPFPAPSDRVRRVLVQECRGVALPRSAVQMLKPPLKGTHHAVIVRRPAPVLVPPNSFFKPVHIRETFSTSPLTRSAPLNPLQHCLSAAPVLLLQSYFSSLTSPFLLLQSCFFSLLLRVLCALLSVNSVLSLCL